MHVFTIPPEKHIILNISGFCTCDCDKDVTKGHIADHLDLLICEQTGKHNSSKMITIWDKSHSAVGSHTITAIFKSPSQRSLPILFVLEPEAVSVSDAFKLVQDYGRENWTRTMERLQQSSGEELQFWDVSVVQFCNIMKQLLDRRTHFNSQD